MDLRRILRSDKFNNIVPVNVSLWLQELRFVVENYDDNTNDISSLYTNRKLKKELGSNISIYDNISDSEAYEDFHLQVTAKEIPRKCLESENTVISSFSVPPQRQILKPIAEESHEEDIQYQKMRHENIARDVNEINEDDPYREITNRIGGSICDLEEKITAFGNIYNENVGTSHDVSNRLKNHCADLNSKILHRHSLPPVLTSKVYEKVNLITVKPPLPPKKKKNKSLYRTKSLLRRNENCRKQFVTLLRVLQSIDASNNSKRNCKCDTLKETFTTEESMDSRKTLRGFKNKPLPFPVNDLSTECKKNEFLLLQKVTDSLKEKRRGKSERRLLRMMSEDENKVGSYVEKGGKDEHLTNPGISKVFFGWDTEKTNHINAQKTDENLRSFMDPLYEARRDIKKSLRSQYRSNWSASEHKLNLREDVIIDWENDYENLKEPMVLESKSLFSQRYFYNYKEHRKEMEAEKNVVDPSAVTLFLHNETSVKASEDALSADEDKLEKSVNFSEEGTLIKIKDTEGENVAEECDEHQSTVEIRSPVQHKDEVTTDNYSECENENWIDPDENGRRSLDVSWGNCYDFNESKCGRLSVSSLSDCEDTLATYSDFETDINEAIHMGENWCTEGCPGERSLSERTETSNLTLRQDSCEEISAIDSFQSNMGENCSGPLTLSGYDTETMSTLLPVGKCNGSLRKSKSVDDLISRVSDEPLAWRSKSLDFFCYNLTEIRLRHSFVADSSESLRSDIVEWISRMRRIIHVEDKFLSCDDREEWFTSFDPEGRLYFFDELSNESSWALPNINADGSDSKYIIQRSATESAVPKDHPEKLSNDGDKRRSRISSCSRSAKTQSMVIEPKLDFSGKDDSKTLSMPRDLTKMYGEIIRSGMLNKTKISENGKKLRKNWTPSFVVLSNTKLLFFKDAKTFHSTKPANDCMCLNLKGAVIEKGDKISSKKNVYKVNSADHVEVLIQTDRTSDAEEWYRDINSVIQNLPRESAETSNSQADPNSPSNVGRTKSVKGKSREGGSMEDLNFSQEERQNKIKAKLKKFFHRRPTVDSLKKKGIWKDEPVFGCSLEQITKNRNPRVPVFVEKCIECIESKEENLKTDGLYRASGNLSQVQKIRLEVDQNNLSIMKEEEDVHVLTGSLKLFFRELKDPLIPFKQLVPALTALNNPKRKDKIREYRKIVGTLPGPNYDTLKFLLQHLLRVEKYNEFNRMNVNNLAIVFGPTLMWPEQESTNMALDFMQQNLVIECLLREFQEIFT